MNPSHLDIYSMMISSKYFVTRDDYINMICVNSKFKEILDMFHYNPIIDLNKTLFKNIETQHIYENEKKILSVNNYVIWKKKYYNCNLKKRELTRQYKNVYYDYDLYTQMSCIIPMECKTLDYFRYVDITSLIIPNNITRLMPYCFDYDELESIKLSTSIRNIPEYCFDGCSSLKEIDLSFVTSINKFSFRYCSSISSITFSKYLDFMDNSSFSDYSSLRSIKIYPSATSFEFLLPYHMSVLFKKENVECMNVSYGSSDLEIYGISIPSTIKCLNDSCFYGQSIEEITFPTTLTKLENECFFNCTKLQRIDLSNIVNTIPYRSFYLCESLTSITFGSHITTLEKMCFLNCSSLQTIKLPQSLISIKTECFKNCISLKEVQFPNSITLIESEAFKNCSQLSLLHVSTSLNTINGDCFENCQSLTTLTLPPNITSLKSSCFSNCTSLEVITLSNGIKTINNCFCNCSKLQMIELPTTLSFIGNYCFDNCVSLTSIILPNIEYIGKQCDLSVIPNGCFMDCSSLKEVKTKEKFVFECNSFEGCPQLTSIQITNCTIIHDKIPYYISKVLNVNDIQCTNIEYTQYDKLLFGNTIPNGVHSIESECFSDCGELETIVIPSSVTYIGDYCFYNCYNLKTITFLSSTTKCGEDCFYGCDSLSF
ncbi:hypothetical protein QTN25_010817 [Entamoeba marina]